MFGDDSGVCALQLSDWEKICSGCRHSAETPSISRSDLFVMQLFFKIFFILNEMRHDSPSPCLLTWLRQSLRLYRDPRRRKTCHLWGPPSLLRTRDCELSTIRDMVCRETATSVGKLSFLFEKYLRCCFFKISKQENLR